MMTIWWANHLTSKDALHVGQKLVIPPVNGLVVTVQPGDTLDSLSAKYSVDATDILAINQLEDPTLIIGQVLIMPDAAGAPIPTAPPAQAHHHEPRAAASCTSCGPTKYGGGKFTWPVIGGGNYISQYFHYGHWAIDIAATYGSKVVAAAKGTVTFAGWKNNGGGYQVWISHGSNLYTTYNHMSAITVSAGQSVGPGPAGRPDRHDRRRDRAAPPLRGLGRTDLERRHARQPAALLLSRPSPTRARGGALPLVGR